MIALISGLNEIWGNLGLPKCSNVAFIPNAKDRNESNAGLEKHRAFLRDFGYEVEEVDLREYSGEELFERLSNFDLIYVAGGNTFVLLENVRRSGFDKVLPRLLQKGIHYVGQSAGGCIMGSSIEPMKYGDKPELSNIKDYRGLNYVDFVFLPHVNPGKWEDVVNRIERDFSSKYNIRKFSDSEGVVIENGKVRIIK